MKRRYAYEPFNRCKESAWDIILIGVTVLLWILMWIAVV